MKKDMANKSEIRADNLEGYLKDDYPEFTQADIDRATFKVKGKVVDKTLWQQAVHQTVKKKRVSIAIDPDVLAFFQEKSGSKGYQTLINQTLRKSMIQEDFKNDLHQIMREELNSGAVK